MSVVPGHLAHDIDSRSSSRVLNRPGGQCNMQGVFGDSSAKFDDGRGSATNIRQYQNQNQPQNVQQVQQPQRHQPSHSTQQNQASVCEGNYINAQNHKDRNYSSHIFETKPVSPVNCPSHRAVGVRQQQSDIFNMNNPPKNQSVQPKPQPKQSQPVQQRPKQQQQSQYQQQPQYQQHYPQQTQEPVQRGPQQPTQQQRPQSNQQSNQPHTSVRVRAPPGGHSSFTLG